MPSSTSRQDGEESRFERSLGPVSALSIGLGTMIGAGIFVLSADAASVAGPAAAVSFVIAGAICVLIAMNVSELVTAMPREGGSYHLISRTLGPMAGSVVGPANWLGLVFAGGFYLIGFAQFVLMLTGIPPWLTMMVSGTAVALLNYWGTAITGQVQRLVVAVLVLVLVAFVARSLFEVEPLLYQPFAPAGWGAAIGVVGLILVSFTGFEKISTVAEEVRRPGRNLPIAIIGSVVIATVVYVAILLVFTGLVPWQEIDAGETALVEVSGQAFGPLGFYAMLGAGLLATLSSANAALLASSRICFAMGRDRILPSWLGAVHREHGTPHRAVVLTAALSLGLALSGAVAQLAQISSALFIVSYALVAVAVIAMRKVAGSYQPRFRVPLYPWLPALGGVAAVAVLFTMEVISLLVGLGLAGASLVWYLAWTRRRVEVVGAVGGWLREAQPLRRAIGLTPRAGPRAARHIVVGLPEAADEFPLIELGRRLATARDAKLEVVRVRVVPEAVPLDRARQDLDRLVVQREVPAPDLPSEQIRPARSVARGVLAGAEELGQVELVLLGREQTRLRRSTDAEVRHRYPGDSAVLSPGPTPELRLRRIRVGWDSSRHARLALSLGRALAASAGAELEAVRVIDHDDPSADARLPGDVSRIVWRAGSVAEGLIDAAKESDLLLIGAGQSPAFHGRMGSTARRVMRESPSAVLVVWSAAGES